MTTSTANFPELLWPGLKKIFGDTYKSWDSKYDKISADVASDKAFEKFQGITGFQAAVEKGQGSTLSYDDMKQGFQKEAVNITFGLGATVTMEMWQDDQYGKIRKLPKALAESYRYTQEIVTADQFNSGFSTAVNPQTSADNLSVFNAAHLLVSGGTYRNTPAVAADLTMSSLEQAYIDISDYVNDRGYPIMARAKTLIVPTALQFVAQKLLETQYAVGSADNDVNVVSKANVPVNLVVNPYLTDPNAWFINTTQDEDGILYVNRMAPEPDRDNVFDTKSLKFSVAGRFTVVTADARGTYGSPGAS
jgi:phage major head subunit gpT-like protein